MIQHAFNARWTTHNVRRTATDRNGRNIFLSLKYHVYYADSTYYAFHKLFRETHCCMQASNIKAN